VPKTTLLLVRHGETDDNKNLVFQGQLGSGLNALGRDQAARLAARLVRAVTRPAALYASDLDRAHETAAILGGALGLEPALDTELREVYLGAWQGLTHAEIVARFPDEWAARRAGHDIRRGGGETYAELGIRVARAIERVARTHPGSWAIVVSHGAALKAFAGRVLGIGAEGLRAFRVQENTGVSIIERDEGSLDGGSAPEGSAPWRLVTWNDAGHLRDPVLEALGG
jgi:probable phosphoglycerate mutase